MSKPETGTFNLKTFLSSVAPPFHLKYWRWLRLAILLVIDLLLIGVAYWASFWLRLDSVWPAEMGPTSRETLGRRSFRVLRGYLSQKRRVLRQHKPAKDLSNRLAMVSYIVLYFYEIKVF